MQRTVEVLSRLRLADRGPLQDEERNRKQRDRGHFLVNVQRHRIERCAWHEEIHEDDGHRAEGQRNRHARCHDGKCGAAIHHSDSKRAHLLLHPSIADTSWSAICSVSSVMPSAIVL